MLIDTHAHIEDKAYDNDRPQVIRRAIDAGVVMITVGVDMASSRAAIAIAAQQPGVYAAVGIHPHEAEGIKPEDIDELRRLCLHPKVVAVGETGLDWYRNLAPQEAQRQAFAAHLALAAEMNLPVIVHNRDADADVMEMLLKTPGVRGVLHAFSSGVDIAMQAISLGFYVSLAGPVTYKNAAKTREVAALAPLDRLLLETDCPYLPPVPWRGQRNEPAYLPLVAEAIAHERRLTVNEVAQATTHNACTLFDLPADSVPPSASR